MKLMPGLRLISPKRKLPKPGSYEEWLESAKAFDKAHGYDIWRIKDQSPYYPYSLLREQMQKFQVYRRRGRIEKLVPYLQESLHRTLGELSDPRLYQVSMVGTKHLVEQYLDEVEETLDYLCDTDFQSVPLQMKKRLFKHSSKIFGETALMLSGGAVFGIYHLGIIKTLLEHGLLPRIISGTSMGSFVTALAGTATDEELLDRLNHPEEIYCDALRVMPLWKILSRRALMDSDQLLQCLHENLSNDTFMEAYQRTGRIINITISPTRSGQKPRILNYKTAPNVVVTYSSLASCSVPLLFAPSQLMAKTSSGEIVPYMEGERWADGSVSHDIPMGRISRLHNANHFIVSQTNPYVLPAINTRQRRGILPYMIDLSLASTHAQWHQLITVSKRHLRNRSARLWLGRMDSLLGQDYLGDINLHPNFPLVKYLDVMKNPDTEQIRAFILEGAQATWPNLARIRNQTRISRALLRCRRKLEAQQ